jgi:hypothetical protein
MLKYIKRCYIYIYDTISSKFDFFYGINKSRLEEENEYYCRMTDGGFLIKDVVPKTREQSIQAYR